MKKGFTGGQMIGVLKEADAVAKVIEFCCKYGISDATYYNWKAKFGGMTVSDAQRLKELEAENVKLKRLLAESMVEPIRRLSAARFGEVLLGVVVI